MSANMKSESLNNDQNTHEDGWEKNVCDDWDDWGDAEDNSDDVSAQIYNKELDTTTQLKVIEIEEAKHKIRENEKQVGSTSWWGGFSSVLSTATESLGSFTSTVSQGLNQVIGVPDPEEMARFNVAESAKSEQNKADKASEEKTEEESTSAFGKNIVSGVTNLGSKVLNTGLDTLEGIGKKTMHILQENDPLLKNKRKILGLDSDRPNLSEVLNEAKKDAEQIENTLKALQISKNEQQMRFEPLFEQNCGLVHLEALDILSKESTLKLQTLVKVVRGKALSDLQETINEVKELMEMEEMDIDSDGDYTSSELNAKLQAAVKDLDLDLQFDDMINNWHNTLNWLIDNQLLNAQTYFEEGTRRLAECCALAMNKLHKIAELLLVKEHHSTASEVDGIVQLCYQFNVHLHGITHRFATSLSALNDEEAKCKLNVLCGELLVAVQQIEEAFKLFLPIIQIGAA